MAFSLRLLFVVLALGCAPRALPCPVCPAGETLAAQDRLAIEWVPSENSGYPTVRPRIAGGRIALVLDSGANHHFVERGAAWWLGLEARQSETDDPSEERIVIAGSQGDLVSMDRLGAVDVDLGLAQLPAAPTELFAGRFPEVMELGIAGVLSPQQLAPENGALELDLRGAGLRVLRRAEIERARRQAGWARLVPVCPAPGGLPLFAVQARVHGEDVDLLVDTGSDQTELYEGASAAHRLRPQRTTWRGGIDGANEVGVAEGVRVEVAGTAVDVAVALLPGEAHRCRPRGVLGNDVLHRCRLVIGRDWGALRCGG